MKQKRKQYGLILCCAALVTAFLFSCARGSKGENTSATHATDAPDPDADYFDSDDDEDYLADMDIEEESVSDAEEESPAEDTGEDDQDEMDEE